MFWGNGSDTNPRARPLRLAYAPPPPNKGRCCCCCSGGAVAVRWGEASERAAWDGGGEARGKCVIEQTAPCSGEGEGRVWQWRCPVQYRGGFLPQENIFTTLLTDISRTTSGCRCSQLSSPSKTVLSAVGQKTIFSVTISSSSPRRGKFVSTAGRRASFCLHYH